MGGCSQNALHICLPVIVSSQSFALSVTVGKSLASAFKARAGFLPMDSLLEPPVGDLPVAGIWTDQSMATGRFCSELLSQANWMQARRSKLKLLVNWAPASSTFMS